MRIVNASIQLEDDIDGAGMLKRLERAARTCYKSEHKITEDSAPGFIGSLIKRGHESVIEHEKVTVRVICDRGVTHEIVRHRIGSYSQESTRYCDYSDHGGYDGIAFVAPVFWHGNPEMMSIWENAMRGAEDAYLEMRKHGAKPEEARSVLPNSLKTEIVITYNLREWRHFLRMRTSPRAHPQMREVACEILRQLRASIPVVFDDLESLSGE